MENLDSTDLQILRHLQEDAHINIKDLASKLFLTSTPVYERIKRLEREGFITKYVALLNKEKMNLGMIVFCNVRLKEHARNVGSNFVKDIVNVEILPIGGSKIIFLPPLSYSTPFNGLTGPGAL